MARLTSTVALTSYLVAVAGAFILPRGAAPSQLAPHRLTQLAQLAQQPLAQLAPHRLAQHAKHRHAQHAKQRLAQLAQQRLPQLAPHRLAQHTPHRLAQLAQQRLAQQRLAQVAKQRLAQVAKQRLAQLAQQRLAQLAQQRLAQLAQPRLAPSCAALAPVTQAPWQGNLTVDYLFSKCVLQSSFLMGHINRSVYNFAMKNVNQYHEKMVLAEHNMLEIAHTLTYIYPVKLFFISKFSRPKIDITNLKFPDACISNGDLPKPWQGNITTDFIFGNCVILYNLRIGSITKTESDKLMNLMAKYYQNGTTAEQNMAILVFTTARGGQPPDSQAESTPEQTPESQTECQPKVGSESESESQPDLDKWRAFLQTLSTAQLQGALETLLEWEQRMKNGTLQGPVVGR